MNRDQLDALLDQLLRETLGGDHPRDMTARVIARAKTFDQVRRRFLISAGAAIAACLALTATLWVAWPRSHAEAAYPDPVADQYVSVPSGGQVTRGVLLATNEHEATLRLGGYVHLTVSPGTSWTIGGTRFREQIILDQGDMDATVNKKRGTFDVLVGGATVSVVGTQFHVGVDDVIENQQFLKRLHVSVAQGTVQVSLPNGFSTALTAGSDQSFDFPSAESSVAAEPSPPLPSPPAPINPGAENDLVPATTENLPSTGSAPVPSTSSAARPNIGPGASPRNGEPPRNSNPLAPLPRGTGNAPRLGGRAGNAVGNGAANAPGVAAARARQALLARLAAQNIKIPPLIGAFELTGRMVAYQNYILLSQTGRGIFLLYAQQEPPAALPLGKWVHVVWENGRITSVTEVSEPPRAAAAAAARGRK